MSASDHVILYDTTLRDGAQGVGVSFMLDDKHRICHALDALNIDYIEAGWPGANPQDTAFFQDPPKMLHSRLVAFGMTAKPGSNAAKDPVLQALSNAHADAVTIVGKCSRFHVEKVLQTRPNVYLETVEQSVETLIASGVPQVFFDAEHFFDGYAEDPEFALSVLERAHRGGASWLVLCDTNGGSTVRTTAQTIKEVVHANPNWQIGMHTHNDSELAVAVAMAGVEAGARMVQGTLNGIGERCGNANLLSLIANLELKSPLKTSTGKEHLTKLRSASVLLNEVLNTDGNPTQAFVGSYAFSHKAGLHASGIARTPHAYEHIDPVSVGNQRSLPISNQAGRASVLQRLELLGLSTNKNGQPINLDDTALRAIITLVKEKEAQGYAYDLAGGSLDLMLLEMFGTSKKYFDIVRFEVTDAHTADQRTSVCVMSRAAIEVQIGDQLTKAEASSGQGPVNALDTAFRRIVNQTFPELQGLELTNYSVRILPPATLEGSGTGATTRVIVQHKLLHNNQIRRFGTVGVSVNIIEASFIALADSYRYALRLMNVNDTTARTWGANESQQASVP